MGLDISPWARRRGRQNLQFVLGVQEVPERRAREADKGQPWGRHSWLQGRGHTWTHRVPTVTLAPWCSRAALQERWMESEGEGMGELWGVGPVGFGVPCGKSGCRAMRCEGCLWSTGYIQRGTHTPAFRSWVPQVTLLPRGTTVARKALGGGQKEDVH